MQPYNFPSDASVSFVEGYPPETNGTRSLIFVNVKLAVSTLKTVPSLLLPPI